MNKRSHRNARALALGLTCITACDPAKLGTLESNATTGTDGGEDDDTESDDTESDDGNSSAGTVSATASSSDPSSPGDSVGSEEDTGAVSTSGNETGGSETGEGLFCDIFAQDCPDGQKCNPWASDANTWNAVGCFGAGDVAIGDECIVEGSGASGVDNCAKGGMCWDVDPETNIGTCIELCSGTVDAPECSTPGTECAILNDGVLPVCIVACDPLVQDCVDGQGCYAFDDRFGCFPDGSQKQGAYLDVCSYFNACDPGLSCLNGDSVAGCVDASCCTPMCDLVTPVCPDTSAGCVPYFAEGEAPIGLESVGFCS